jgi:predicted Fe-S protein YdhL (DUF1289 family)
MTEAAPIPTPCRGICRLGRDEVCDGCGRTIGEIVIWARLEPATRARVLARVAAWVPREHSGGERGP